MRRFCVLLCVWLVCGQLVTARGAQSNSQSSPQTAEEYPLGPDSQRQAGVPQGKVTKYTWVSKIFPGTVRDYYVYVPAQYTPDKPACVMLFDDGKAYVSEDGRARIPIVFDNLIAKHDMPVTIAILIDPGVLKDASGKTIRINRSYEYDSLSDRYARFLLDEILPEVAKSYNLSKDPNDRAIGGSSSGGIGSFTVAWMHPEAFHRVLSFIGSFADLRGGDIYPELIRKTEPKPIRVFLQDGNHDLNNFAGDWWLANQSMASALAYAGYDFKFVTGTKDHDLIQGGAIMPYALRWLWRDYPQPIAKPTFDHLGDRQTGLVEIEPEWEKLGDAGSVAKPRNARPTDSTLLLRLSLGLGVSSWPVNFAAIAADRQGNVFTSTPLGNGINRFGLDGKATAFVNGGMGVGSFAFGPDGLLYACDREGIITYAPDGTKRTRLRVPYCESIAVNHDGGVYFAITSPLPRLGFLPPGKATREKEFRFESGGDWTHSDQVWLSLSPDQSIMYISHPGGKWVWSNQVQVDGSLTNIEPFFRLETPDDSSASGASGMVMGERGLLYVATRLGVQICDAQGRVVAILNPPESSAVEGAQIAGLALGGPDHQYLYAVIGNQVFRRHLIPKTTKP